MKLYTNNNSIEEITLILTDDCNLKCDFCNVVNNNVAIHSIDYHTIVSKIDVVSNIIKSTCKNTIAVVLMGGELFQDKFTDQLINGYQQLLSSIEQLCKQHDKSLQITLMTNMIYKRVDRVIAIAKRFNAEVHASFDFVGRFDNTKLIDLWFTNAQTFIDSGVQFSIGLIATKPNVDRIVNHDPLWNRLVELADCYIQPYECTGIESIDDKYRLTDAEIIKFYLWICDNYPDEKYTRSIIECYNTRTNFCVQSTYIDKTCHKCCDHNKLQKVHFVNHKCFQCQYYDRCPLVCPRIFATTSICLVKSILDHVNNRTTETTGNSTSV